MRDLDECCDKPDALLTLVSMNTNNEIPHNSAIYLSSRSVRVIGNTTLLEHAHSIRFLLQYNLPNKKAALGVADAAGEEVEAYIRGKIESRKLSLNSQGIVPTIVSDKISANMITPFLSYMYNYFAKNGVDGLSIPTVVSVAAISIGIGDAVFNKGKLVKDDTAIWAAQYVVAALIVNLGIRREDATRYGTNTYSNIRASSKITYSVLTTIPKALIAGKAMCGYINYFLKDEAKEEHGESHKFLSDYINTTKDTNSTNTMIDEATVSHLFQNNISDMAWNDNRTLNNLLLHSSLNNTHLQQYIEPEICQAHMLNQVGLMVVAARVGRWFANKFSSKSSSMSASI